MSNTLPIILLTIFWTPIYWLIGGTIFAVIGFLAMMKVRKALFGFLFAFLTLIIAIAAGYSGIAWSQAGQGSCIVRQEGFIDQISGIIACGILEISFMGLIGFITLLVLGGLLLYICRAKNQSWVDSDHGVNEKNDVLVFDNGPRSY